MARKPRHLSPEEREMWDRVARTLTRRKPAPKPATPAIPAPPPPVVPRPTSAPLPALARIGARTPPKPLTSFSPAPDPMHRTDSAQVLMDHKTFGRMKKGKLLPEARIDLHGMTAERAHRALNGFILRAFAGGQRLVLVITGKGRAPGDPDALAPRKGVLRHAVPEWLRQPPLDQVVLQIASAHRNHGGSGAYYVYLRRS